jgi:hypothetical protein
MRAPLASPTPINTQKRAAVPKISEAMAGQKQSPSYLAAPGPGSEQLNGVPIGAENRQFRSPP